MLAMYVDENRSDWDDHLPYIMMAYRAAVHESTKCTPNLLMLGREICLPIDIIAGSLPDMSTHECPIKYVEWVKDAMERSFEFAHENLESSFRRQKRNYDVKLKPRQFDKDELVWYWYPPKAKQKLGLGLTGPFKIVRKISEVNYQIESCHNKKMRIVHVDHLKKVEGNGYENQLLSVDSSLRHLLESGFSSALGTETEGTENETVLHNSESTETDYENVEEHNENDQQTLFTSPKYSSRGRPLKPKVPYSPCLNDTQK